jgi:copper(I)-binding protein
MWTLSACQPAKQDVPSGMPEGSTMMGAADDGEAASQAQADLPAQGLVVEDAWARPGMQGGMSAAYFRISNGQEADDRLVNASSDLADLTEIHESYDQPGGMKGMRKVDAVEVPGRSSVLFRQGGLHVMFIRLNRALAEGDSVTLTLDFEKAGQMVVEVPVRMP